MKRRIFLAGLGGGLSTAPSFEVHFMSRNKRLVFIKLVIFAAGVVFLPASCSVYYRRATPVLASGAFEPQWGHFETMVFYEYSRACSITGESDG